MTNNDELALKAESIIADIKRRHKDIQIYAPIITWSEFESLLAERDADKKRIAELSAHLGNAHAFIENTEAFGREAATGIIKCGDAEWNIDNSKSALSEGGIKLEVGE